MLPLIELRFSFPNCSSWACRSEICRSRSFISPSVTKSFERKSSEKGGDLGWVRDDALAPAIRTAVTGLQEGGVSEPVRMPEGWHLLKLTGTKPAGLAPLTEVRSILIEALRKQRLQQNAQAYTAAAMRSQPPQIDEIAIGKLTTH